MTSVVVGGRLPTAMPNGQGTAVTMVAGAVAIIRGPVHMHIYAHGGLRRQRMTLGRRWGLSWDARPLLFSFTPPQQCNTGQGNLWCPPEQRISQLIDKVTSAVSLPCPISGSRGLLDPERAETSKGLLSQLSVGCALSGDVLGDGAWGCQSRSRHGMEGKWERAQPTRFYQRVLQTYTE